MSRVSGTRAEIAAAIEEIGLGPATARFSVAALLYTYRCTIACRHCMFGCATHRPDVCMDTGRAVDNLRQLHELGRVVHIAGGEAMMYWDNLKEVLELAFAEGVQPHFIETNCSFAVNDEIVRERLGVMKANGVVGIYFSADPYHQAFVPPENIFRVRDIAVEVLGFKNLYSGTRDVLPDEEVRRYGEIARDETRLRESVRDYPPMLIGTGYRELRQYCDQIPLADLSRRGSGRVDCADCFSEDVWEVHIDPYDNIVTNCGVIMGNATKETVAEVLGRPLADKNVIVRILSEKGAAGLAEFARDEHGFEIPQTACTFCDLCYIVRRFLRPFYAEMLGPEEVYSA